MNFERMAKLADAVERSKTYDQGAWWVGGSPGLARSVPITLLQKDKGRLVSECGSPGCLAGHAALLWPDDVRSRSWADVLPDTLGLTYAQGEALAAAEWEPGQIADAFDVDEDYLRELFPHDHQDNLRVDPSAKEAAAVLRLLVNEAGY